jgi:probable HAF family extracellular repeat protein
LEALEDRCLLSYTIWDLTGSSFSGGRISPSPHGINNVGQVVGTLKSHAVVWDPKGDVRDLGEGNAYVINDASQVIWRSFTFPGDVRHDWLTEPDGTTTEIPFPALGFSNTGQVIGSGTISGSTHILAWDPSGGEQDLGPLGSLGGEGYTNEINDAGGLNQVVGAQDIPNDNHDVHPFLWDSQNAIQDLGALGPSPNDSRALAINSLGQVVGYSGPVPNPHPFFYDGTMHDLGTLPGQTFGFAYGLNNVGVVVGAGNGTSPSFVYADGTLMGLNDLIEPGSGLTITTPLAVNDAGWIAAKAEETAHPQLIHWVVLKPDDGQSPLRVDPSAFRLLASSAGPLGVTETAIAPEALVAPTQPVSEAAAPLPTDAMLRRATDIAFASSHRPQPTGYRGSWEGDGCAGDLSLLLPD